ncbi:MAG TPA: hypothetical protein VIC26_02120 [Marinagarivorans sp.]
MMKTLKLPVMVALLSAAAGASADINFRGFGSIVGGQAISVDDGQTVLGYSDTLSFKRDSLIALQMDSDLGDRLSATMQLMSRGKNDYDVNVEWAYLTYEINDELQLSGGRIRAPFYRYSDFLDVRYAYNWITAPARVYSFEFPGFDGLSLLWNSSVGPVDSSLQLVAGSMDGFTGSTPILLEDFVGVSWIGSWEWLTGRASYLHSSVTIAERNIESTADAYQALGEGMLGVAQGFGGVAQAYQGAALGDRAAVYSSGFMQTGSALVNNTDNISIEGDAGAYMAFGVSVDKGAFIADAEWIHYELDDALIPNTSAYYVTLGWRAGPTVIYGTYSREEADANTAATSVIPDLSLVAGAIAGDAGLASALQAIPSLPDDLNANAVGLVTTYEGLRAQLNSADVDVVNMHLGVRWDFHPSAALKVAYEVTDDRISDIQGGLFRTAIDFVF